MIVARHCEEWATFWLKTRGSKVNVGQVISTYHGYNIGITIPLSDRHIVSHVWLQHFFEALYLEKHWENLSHKSQHLVNLRVTDIRTQLTIINKKYGLTK